MKELNKILSGHISGGSGAYMKLAEEIIDWRNKSVDEQFRHCCLESIEMLEKIKDALYDNDELIAISIIDEAIYGANKNIENIQI